MSVVAVLGTGRMGAEMATRVAVGGYSVVLWNRTGASAERTRQAILRASPEAEVSVAETPAAAVGAARHVLSMFADGAATCAVLLDDAVHAALRPGTVVCDLGTSGPVAARELADGLSGAGVLTLDAPVSGSVPAARAGTLLVMAGGSEEAVAAASPVLSTFARRVMHVGPAGSGQSMKLAVNLVVHDLNAALAESLLLAERSGIDPSAAYDVLQESVVAAPLVTYKRAAFLGDPTVAMSLELVDKDLHLILDLATKRGVEARTTRATQQAVASAVEDGYGASDMAALLHHQRGQGSVGTS